MSPTDLRDTLTTVRDAVPVPPPDAVGFRRRVARARRRRTAVRVVGAAAAVALVAGGSALALAGGGPRRDLGPAGPPPGTARPATPVVLDGELAWVGPDGGADRTGLLVTDVVGRTPQGLVVLTPDDELARVAGESVERLADAQVRRAFVAGDGVVYQTYDGLVAWTSDRPPGTTAQLEGAQLLGAGTGRVVVQRDGDLYALDAAGEHRLWYEPGQEPQVLHLPVDVGGNRVAVSADTGLTIFAADGLHAGSLGGDRLGRLAPDGSTYARQGRGRRGLELVDPQSLDVTPVAGPVGAVTALRWDGSELLVVAGRGHVLWRCAGGTDCVRLYDDPDGAIGL